MIPGFSLTHSPFLPHVGSASPQGPGPSASPPSLRSSPPPSAASVGWPSAPAAAALSACLLVDGDHPFDRHTLEGSGLLPGTPHAILYCNEFPGNTATERGQSLLAEIRRRKAGGEFGVDTPALLFLHAHMHNGELMVGDWHGRLALPLAVLLHALSAELFTRPQGAPAGSAAPVILSGCEAGAAAEQLRDFPRPILINGGDDDLFVGDARAVFRASVQMAERSWRDGARLPAAVWFDRLAAVSGEVLQQTGMGEWLVHDLLESSASLASCSTQQAALCLRAKLMHGSVDELAEALLLFGTGSLSNDGGMPAMHFLLQSQATQLHVKVALLAAAGVDIDQRDATGRSALHRVCDLRDEAGGADPRERGVLLRLLLANGAQPDLADATGQTPRSLVASGRGRALRPAFDPGRIARDRDMLGVASLRAAAINHQWDNVLSLLDNPRQTIDIDDDGEDADLTDAGCDGNADQISENSDS